MRKCFALPAHDVVGIVDAIIGCVGIVVVPAMYRGRWRRMPIRRLTPRFRRRRLACWPLTLAHALATHQLVLRRVITIHPPDGGPHALDHLPNAGDLCGALVA